jgi:O-antigen/teichoic acid export membrane protein
MASDVYHAGAKNIFYTVSSQGISLVLGIVTGIVLPKVLGLSGYGYWQVYLLYVGYVMIVSAGFNDGLTLRYGNCDYVGLPFGLLRSTLRIYMCIVAVLASVLFVVAMREPDSNRMFAFCAVAVDVLIMGVHNSVLGIVQVTNRLKLYGALTIASKVVFVLAVISLILLGQAVFWVVIIGDIFVRILILLANMYASRELFVGGGVGLRLGFVEWWANIRVGISLMLALLIDALLLGVGRFVVERFMSLEEYSRYSFAITMVMFLVAFTTASSLAIYPLLTRVDANQLPRFYKDFNVLIVFGLLVILCVYFPMTVFLKTWLSDFAGVLRYFQFLILIVVIQGKSQLLVNSYFKVLRKERKLLFINLAGTACCLLAIGVAFYFTRSILAIVLGTVFSLLLRVYGCEIYLKLQLGIRGLMSMVSEVALMGLFSVCAVLDWTLGLTIYVMALGLFGFVVRRTLIEYLRWVRRTVAKR